MKHMSQLHDCLYELDSVGDILTVMHGELQKARDQQRRFSAGASHELRTPLAGLRAQLEEARLHPGETPLPELLDHLSVDVDRLQQIITDLLLLVHLESGATTNSEPLDLAELVQTYVRRRRDAIEVRLRLEPGVTVNCVGSLIGRVFSNLLDNAQRHATRTVEAQVRRDGDCAELSVSDDGQGVPVASRERIFELFSRLDTARDRDTGGTGLGLAIARNIAIAHHGTLVVQDALCGGARFVFRLPLAHTGRTEDQLNHEPGILGT